MADKVIDMSYRKKIKIIFPEKKKRKYIDNNATLKIKRETKGSCASIDPIGLCTVVDCLTCKNSDYKIILNNGEILKDFKSKDESLKEEKYVIEFFDELKKDDNILDYLDNEESNYRIIRDNDGVILHYSKEDIKEKEDKLREERKEFTKMYQKLDEQIAYYEDLERLEATEEKPKSLLKRVKDFLRTNNSIKN